jgi:hypothetical protein
MPHYENSNKYLKSAQMIEDYVTLRTHIRWAKLKKSWKAAPESRHEDVVGVLDKIT